MFRVDRILEGAVGVQEYKNSVNPGSHISGRISLNVCPGLTRGKDNSSKYNIEYETI